MFFHYLLFTSVIIAISCLLSAKHWDADTQKCENRHNSFHYGTFKYKVAMVICAMKEWARDPRLGRYVLVVPRIS
jgi:hypothetical protein